MEESGVEVRCRCDGESSIRLGTIFTTACYQRADMRTSETMSCWMQCNVVQGSQSSRGELRASGEQRQRQAGQAVQTREDKQAELAVIFVILEINVLCIL